MILKLQSPNLRLNNFTLTALLIGFDVFHVMIQQNIITVDKVKNQLLGIRFIKISFSFFSEN